MKVGVVLGSGGHTSEMLRTISEIPSSFWHDNRPFYIVSATDAHSSDLARRQEQALFQRRAIVYTIPRAREVGQNYISSIASTLKAAIASLRVIVVEKPDVLLTNGPGVCIPVIVAAMCITACLPWWYKRPAIVYMESFTCVAHPSLSGLLLAPFMADVFTVHWRSLERVVRRYRRRGTLVYVGCEGTDEEKSGSRTTSSDSFPPPLPPGKESYALVTVGSTKFTALVEAMVQPELCAALKKHFQITKLYVQYGTAALPTPESVTTVLEAPKGEDAGLQSSVQQWNCGGLGVEAFPYRPHLNELIRTATLVVTHAGAGTILEGLQARRPLVVVPNRQLMSDHQMELAGGLAAGRFLFSLQVTELAERLPTLDVSVLRPHQGMDVEQLKRSLWLVLAGRGDATAKNKVD
ncbi:putative glycosyltransferase family 28 protein [Leptomonas seymouri]|uniref:UDP-N-acetylglucosamine transferase subunit ALG14 n=1 Tax=Leptomonas seymouri TaxID=5684 RepID=A0A0N1I7X1_LEPSE|nr:putative glycosyltransferase family 28 protein [Leptomonas seymouri]|eukprot:KPI88731.1 putative glycosyltransferase family 28 protein [Leptomonas seymouri]